MNRSLSVFLRVGALAAVLSATFEAGAQVCASNTCNTLGTSIAYTGTGYALQVTSSGNNTTNYAIWAETTTGPTGVYGSGTTYGVEGVGSGGSGAGVFGTNSSNSIGVQGNTAGGSAGVLGTNNGSSYSVPSGSFGVFGYGNSNGDGVHGVSSNGSGSGVAGINSATSGTGVYGSATSSTAGWGVQGVANSSGTGSSQGLESMEPRPARMQLV